MKPQLQAYDVVIIGSGLGSLTCASFIAQMYGHSVLVVEQHAKAGGLSGQIITDQGVAFEIGIHQVGELDSSSMFSKLMNYISRGKSIWRKLPETFIKFKFPDFVYEVSSGEEKQISRLSGLFPGEEDAIRQYYSDVDSVTKWYRKFTTESLANNKPRLAELLSTQFGEMAMLTTESYLNSRFKSVRLRSLIGSHWTDYGLPPSASAFLKHAILVNNHKEGVYYPEFGSGQLIESIVDSITDNRGEFIYDSTVKEIICEGSLAVAVRIVYKTNGQETIVQAKKVISGIGVINTYTKLLSGQLDEERSATMSTFANQGVSFIKLFATLREDPSVVGADASLCWVYPGYDHKENFENRDKFSTGEISQFSISFPSLKKSNSSRHTMKINTLVDYSAFRAFANGQSEEAVRETIGKNLLQAAEKLYPGLSALIESWELYTPLTAQKETGHVNGNIFGIPDTPARYKSADFNCHTPIQNVYLTGSDITSSGIYGAILSGALTTSAAFDDKQFFLKVIQKVSSPRHRKEAVA